MLAAVKIAVILNMNQQIPAQDDYSVVRISLQLDSPYKSHPAFKTGTRGCGEKEKIQMNQKIVAVNAWNIFKGKRNSVFRSKLS